MKSSQSMASHDRSTVRYLQHAFQVLGLKAEIEFAKDRSAKVLVGLDNGETLRVLIYPPSKDKTKLSVTRILNEGDPSQVNLEREEFMGLYSKCVAPKAFIKYAAKELEAIARIARVDYSHFMEALSSIPEEGILVTVRMDKKKGMYVVQEGADLHPSP